MNQNFTFTLPSSISHRQTEDPNKGIFVFSPMSLGLGHTIGTSLRRTLLNHSMAVSPVKIKISGCAHEHDDVPGVREPMLHITNALRRMPISAAYEFDDLKELSIILPAEPRIIKCKDLPRAPGIDFPDSEHVLFETTGTESVSLTVWFGCGRPTDNDAELQEKLDQVSFDSTTIDIAPLFKSINRVGVVVSEVNKGNRRFDSLELTILTDGSISPECALQDALKLYFEDIAGRLAQLQVADASDERAADEVPIEILDSSLRTLGLTPAITSCLEMVGLDTVRSVTEMSIGVVQSTPELTDPVLHSISDALQRKHRGLNIRCLEE
jgi:DNA-directed RNA polymerase subunit alpha